jgi:hypothetical protein
MSHGNRLLRVSAIKELFMRNCVPKLLLSLLVGCVGLLPATRLFAQGFDVQLEPLQGQSQRVLLTAISENGALQGTGWNGELSLSLISQLDFGRPVQAPPEGSLVLRLVGGGQLSIRSPRTAEEQLLFEATTVEGVVSLEAVTAIVWKENERVAAAIAAPLSDNDQVLVETPEGTVVVAGLLEGLTGDKVQVNYQDKSRTIGLEKVLAIVPASVGSVSSASSSNLARLLLTDGSSVGGQLLSLTMESWTLKLANGSLLKGPATALSRIDVASDRQAFLSDLNPLESEQRVLFGQPRDWTRDQALSGGSLRLQRQPSGEVVSFRKGLGMRATTRVVFANDRGFNKLVAEVGLDPELGQQGDCEVTIRGDGIELWKRRLQSSQPVAQVDVEIAGYQRIELSVQSGEQFDLGDFVNWCNPRMLKLEK